MDKKSNSKLALTTGAIAVALTMSVDTAKAQVDPMSLYSSPFQYTTMMANPNPSLGSIIGATPFNLNGVSQNFIEYDGGYVFAYNENMSQQLNLFGVSGNRGGIAQVQSSTYGMGGNLVSADSAGGITFYNYNGTTASYVNGFTVPSGLTTIAYDLGNDRILGAYNDGIYVLNPNGTRTFFTGGYIEGMAVLTLGTTPQGQSIDDLFLADNFSLRLSDSSHNIYGNLQEDDWGAGLTVQGTPMFNPNNTVVATDDYIFIGGEVGSLNDDLLRPSTIPEPSSLSLLLLGGGAYALMRRKDEEKE
jgi:hypothetical protein